MRGLSDSVDVDDGEGHTTATLGARRVAQLLRASYEADLGSVAAFLPERVPLEELPGPLEQYVSACAELPAHYAGGSGVRKWLERKFPCEDPAVTRAIDRAGTAERETLMTALGVLGHTYRWDRVPPAPRRFEERRIMLPLGIAGPWAQLARALDQPRVGTTWSLHLCNWRMSDRPGGAEYRPDELNTENLRIGRSWLLPPVNDHLERFSLSFVLLEAQGAAILRHVVDAIDAAGSRDLDDTLAALACLRRAIAAMTRGFSVQVRKRTVDPAIWLNLVQPTFAWSAEADEPGCTEGGPSGLQVPTIQALDSALGTVGLSTLARLAAGGRRLMPRAHRRFLERVHLAGPVLRQFVIDSSCSDLTDQYNKCILGVFNFRAVHHARALRYLGSRCPQEPSRVSTGLTIGIDDDAIAVVERTMSERALETEAAML